MTDRQWKFTRDFLLGQLQRMAGFIGYPTTGDDDNSQAVAELMIVERMRALDEACHSEAHVVATIDEWMYEERGFPTPAELREIAWAQREKYALAPPPECAACNGTGWLPVQVRKGGMIYEAGKPCQCRQPSRVA